MTSSRTDQQRVEHARRLLAAAPKDLIYANWKTLLWIAEQVPHLLDVIDHLTSMREPARVATKTLPGNDNGAPILELHLPEKPCGCGVLLGEVCDCREYAPPQTWGWMR